MAELHPGPDVSLGQLEAQLRNLGLTYNQDFFYAKLGGEWALTLSDENYERWQEAHGGTESEEDAADGDAKSSSRQSGADEDTSSATKDTPEESDAKSDTEADEKSAEKPGAKAEGDSDEKTGAKAEGDSDEKTDVKADTTARRAKPTHKAR